MAETEPPEPVVPEPAIQATAGEAVAGEAVAEEDAAADAVVAATEDLAANEAAADEVAAGDRTAPPARRVGLEHQPAPREPRGQMITLILALFLGSFGIHRFYTGYTTAGLIQLFTAGGCGIWWAVDVTMIIMGRFRDAEGRALV